MSLRTLVMLVGLLNLTFANLVSASEPEKVGADELKEMIIGKTVHNSCQVTGEVSRTYFDPSGKLTRNDRGTIIEGSYFIKPNGMTCNVLNGKNLCANIFRIGDGTFHRVMPNGKRVGIWNKIVPGNDTSDS